MPLKYSSGDWVPCQMVVDPPSESSFITESMAQGFKLLCKKYSEEVVGVGSSKFSNNHDCISCEIALLSTKDSILSVKAIVIEKICPKLL